MQEIICVVGKDARQKAAAQTLRQTGYEIVGAEAVQQAGTVLFPMVMDGQDAATRLALANAREGTLLLCGRQCPMTDKEAAKRRLEKTDYYACPELECLNAVPTAEGCLSLLMQYRDQTIWESSFLLLGYGRVGRAVAKRLLALGGRVTVAARNAEQRTSARCNGCRAASLEALPQLLPKFETVINTIPAKVLGLGELQCLPTGALILDLASRPGGTDFEAAQKLGLRAEHALSLPLRCAPQTAGMMVAQTVMSILEERGKGNA